MDPLLRLSNNPRVTIRRAGSPDPDGTCVVYWMQRAQRGRDNPALDFAVEAANVLGKPVVVFFAPRPFPPANLRHYSFVVQGIPDIAEALEKRGIGFVLRPFPDHSLLKFCDEVRPALVVGDENPIRQAEGWRVTVAKKLKLPLWTVDADVIVPSKLLEKEQYAAHTIRPRLQARLKEFLIAPANPKAKIAWKNPRTLESLGPAEITLESLTNGWKIDRSTQPVSSWHGGSTEAHRLLKDFICRKLERYTRDRHHPETEGTTRLSTYLHFGHIGPHTIALAVQNADAPSVTKEAFLNQLITWRELSINLVHFNSNYDNFDCGEPWAHRSLAKHAKDPRPVVYSEKQLENAETHDPLWNAAQMQMVSTGWMHNYLRMYWAKKILEWTPSPAQAYQIAIRLNDKYELDGRDPNGYAGIAWSIVGKFDRPWFERPIFGQIRYMSGASTGKKFDSKKYIAQNTQGRMFVE
ncbi:MAG: deoxyribodipyrimidine photo-lyase [Acidobacteria bacterium]|nr:deoxyribodipyrimidine photo-lyase [Acidobacteriota bacterium]